MAIVKCSHCASEISDQTVVCPHCGQSEKTAPIHRPAGKLKAIGVLLVATGIIGMIAGTWWGGALLFPGVALFMVGQVW